VPKLRFPEFHGAALWSVLLGDVTEECRSRNGNKHSSTLVMGVTKAEGIVPMEARLIAADTSRYKLVETDWFAYNPMRLNIGSIARWEGGHEILVSPDYVVFKCITNNEPGCSPAYLDQFRKTKAWEEFVTEGGDGSVRVRIYYKDIARICLSLPPLREQQKVADCLSSLDELIATQAQKVDALKTHKKGLMQQLFPREGESVPARRFTEFKAAGDWMILPLAALADRIMVGIASAATHAYRETGVPMLRNQNIKEGKIDDFNLLFIDPIYERAHKGKRLRKGDVITVRTGYPGVSAVVPEQYENAQCFTSLITRPKNKILDPAYLCAFINSDIGKKFILGAEAGGAQKNVNAGALEMLPVYLPSLEEQRRISACLSNLDALITAETQKLEALKAHKKGLMQQLFPSAEEVTL
jgi:type I restriction enzyme S subunit